MFDRVKKGSHPRMKEVMNCTLSKTLITLKDISKLAIKIRIAFGFPKKVFLKITTNG